MMGHSRPPSAFSDSDLNGLVDGGLASGRQAELLLRLKSHGAERSRVAAWREQTDLLRASFSEVENETIPLSLSLTPPPRLKCITTNSRSVARPLLLAGAPASVVSPNWTRQSIVGFAAAIGSLAFVICWLIMEHVVPIEPTALLLAATGRPDGMLVTPSFEVPEGTARERIGTKEVKPVRLIHALPTATIPNLTNSGFSFTGATVQRDDPVAVSFSYENAAGDRVVLTVSKTPTTKHVDAAFTAPADRVVAWQRQGSAYTLIGMADRRRLNAIALDLQAEGEAADK